MRRAPRSYAGDWHYPTEVRFGAGRLAELGQACRALGLERPLLVTDDGLIGSPMADAAASALEAAGFAPASFGKVHANPTADDVALGVETLRRGAHDGVIALGGGSALDAGKAMGFMAPQAHPLWDFEDGRALPDETEIAEPLPVIAVPTTAGTGAEVGRVAVITDPGPARKRLVFHPRMMPRLVIADPTLTFSLPAPLTAATGMDALAHALEAYLVPAFHPMADGIALEAMRLIAGALPVAFRRGDDAKARAEMMAAALMAAVAFQKGLGAIHALSHPVGGVYGLHHGLTNAVLMPYVLAFNAPACGDKLARLARHLSLRGEGADAVQGWVLALRRELAIPHTLARLGVEARDVARLADLAARDPSAPTNPLPLARASLEGLYRAALAGDLAHAAAAGSGG